MKYIRGLHISYYLNFVAAVALLKFGIFVPIELDTSALLKIDMAVIILTMVAILYFGVHGIITAVKLFRANDLTALRRHMKHAKVGMIPFFIINFIYYLALIMLVLGASRGLFLFGPIFVVIVPIVIFTYLAVLFTSAFTIAYILLMKKNNQLTGDAVVLHICLQLIFVLDMVSMFILLRKKSVLDC